MGANLKEVRESIKSVQSTQQITKAMKMVSAAKLRKAQGAIVQMRPYADKLNGMLQNILSNLDGDMASSLGTARSIEKVAIVIVTSNRGLCGGFNSNIIKAAAHAIKNTYAEQRSAGNLTILCIGKKGYDYAKRNFSDCEIINEYVTIFEDLSFDNVSVVSKRLMRGFENRFVDRVEVAYGRFKNAATQIAELDQFLPVPPIKEEETEGKDKKTKADYIFEPSKEELLEHLIPSILQTTFQKYLLETHASEHGARMTAMDKATENAEEMMKDLKVTYNKARQEAITKELSEIVGGAAALEG